MYQQTNQQTNQHHHGQHIKRQGISENDFPLRILVQSDMVGAIIGRSGSTIKQITQQSKAKIDVHREDSLDQQEKVITINGSPESCSTACFKIIDIIMNERMQLNHKNNNNNVNSSQDHEQTSANNNNNNNTNNNNNNNNEFKQQQDQNNLSYQDSEVRLKILAHNSCIGRLIGSGGHSLKKIMEQTSTKINISGNSLTDCTHERTITVSGKLNQVRQAEKVISSKLRAAYMSDINVQLQAMSQQPYLFNNVPLPYMPGSYAQNPILSSLVNSQTGHGGHAMSRAIGPHQNQTLYPNSTNFLSLYPNLGIPPSLLGFNPSGSLDVEKETVHIYVPSKLIGAIIGKSGSAIKEMISSSGASIKVVAAPTTNTNSTEIAPNGDNINTTSATKTLIKEDGSIKSEQRIKINSTTNESNNATEKNNAQNSVEDSNQDNGVVPAPNSMQDSQTIPSATSPQPTTPRYLNHSSSNNNNNNNSESYPSTRKVTIIGTPESQWSAQYLIYRKVGIENGKSDISLMVEIEILTEKVGKLIGKGGATIKNIQKQTRTTIRLQPSNNDNETSVQITGEFQCTQLAQRHIRNLIKERF